LLKQGQRILALLAVAGAQGVWHYGLWVLRGSLLLWLFGVLQPPIPRTILGDPQTVNTTQPLMCVHTRLIDEVFEWNIQRSLQMVREMGVDTIVEFFPWAYLEPQAGQYHWEQADRIIRHAQNQGLTVIARMGYVPYWARPGDPPTTLNELPPESYDEFGRFVAAFAARYTPTVTHVILWNEPNLSFEWGYRPVSPLEYTQLLRVVYPLVKTTTPEVQVLAGALAPTLEPPTSPNGLEDLLYLQGMYQAGAADYFDGLAVHTYGFQQPALAEPDPQKLNFRRVELLRELMLRYDDATKPVYITETGWNDHPRWVNAVRPSLRVQYTLEAYQYAAEHWDWLQELCLWAFRYPRYTYGYPDHFMIVSVGFEPSPLYTTLQAYARGQTHGEALWLPPPVER
jgi:polysaccharide biosynthesis protein PslG